MANPQKRPSELGAEPYAQNLPAPEEIPPAAARETDLFSGEPGSNRRAPKAKKVRKTYALRPDTHLALEEIRLHERKRGRNVTLGDLMEEAVQLLIREKLGSA